MKLPYNWLKDFLPKLSDINDVANTLTLAGLEVDGISGISFEFEGVITAKVLEVEKHPDSDKLQIAKVDTGSEVLQIVCGASNCRKGIITALAPIGSKLNPSKKPPLQIQKTKIRNVDSFGMLCSKDELGLEETSDGIIELPAETEVGIKLEELFYNPVLEISLTPNLGHCFSVLGVARELSYKSDEKLISPALSTKVKLNHTHDFQIQNHSKDCEEFHLAIIKNVQIKSSPSWLAERLKLSGMKSINNVVDALNYVMLELGQPMHAYDHKKLGQKELAIKECPHETPFVGLDTSVRSIPKGTLMIYNSNEPVAVAGIIGSYESMVSEETTEIVLEAAHFNSKKIRQGMKSLGLRTEAGAHFEKGIDRAMIKLALARACEIIHLTCESASESGYNFCISKNLTKKSITLRPSRVNQIIGIHLSNNEIESILAKLGCKVTEKNENLLILEIPSFRNDINEEIDLVEEVARIYGFNNIEKSQGFYRLGTVANSPVFEFEQTVRNYLLSLGLQELITCNLISPKQSLIGLSKDIKETQLISMLHAKSVDQSILRPSLIPSFLQTVKHNLSFNTKSIKAFEIGRVHFFDHAQAQEKFAIGIMLTGKEKEHFSDKGQPYCFYDLKGILESLLETLGIESSISFSTSPAFHPGQQAKIIVGDEDLGIFGQLHPSEAKKADVDVPVFFAQFDLLELMKHSTKTKKMTKLAEFPSSTRDVTLTLNKTTSYSELLNAAQMVNLSILKQIDCLDIFNSTALGSKVHNVTFRMTYRSDDKTLDFETVEKGHQAILQALMPLTSS